MAGKPLPEQGQTEVPVVRRSNLGWTATRSDSDADPRWMAVARQRVQNPAYRRTLRSMPSQHFCRQPRFYTPSQSMMFEQTQLAASGCVAVQACMLTLLHRPPERLTDRRMRSRATGKSITVSRSAGHAPAIGAAPGGTSRYGCI